MLYNTKCLETEAKFVVQENGGRRFVIHLAHPLKNLGTKNRGTGEG